MRSLRSASAILALGTLVTLVLLAGCDRRKSDEQPAPSISAAASSEDAEPPAPQPAEVATMEAKRPLRGRPKNFTELPTSSADAFEANVKKQIADLEAAVQANPESVPRIRMLSASLHAEARRNDDLDGIQHAIDVLEKAIALTPAAGPLYLDRANIELSLHRFDKATADVAKAAGLGAPPDDGVAEELAWNAGDYDTAMKLVHAASERGRTMWTEAREAELHHDLGQELAADRSYETAEDLIDDPSPLPVAWLDTQRGIHEVGFGRLQSAIDCFREALRRVPNYPPAGAWLAKTLRWFGNAHEAEAVESTLPPHTAAHYDELLAKYPEATYADAGAFFLGPGKNPKRAVELFTKNLAITPNSASLVALARAELAVGDDKAARANVDKALAMPPMSATLAWTASRAYAKTDAAKSRTYADKAKGMNAYVSVIEAPPK